MPNLNHSRNFRFGPFCLLLCAFFFVGCASHLKLAKPIPPTTSIESPEFREAMGSLITPGFLPGNKVEALNNGVEIFPAMLQAIREARKTINFETFIFYDGEIPRQFADALSERARAGVQVRVVLDALGASKSRSLQHQMIAAGVKLEKFHSVWWHDPRRYNRRTHRKLLIVDARVAFIGGVGIGDEWDGNVRSPKEWRDMHFRVRGPVVNQLQAAFNDHWFDTAGEVLQGKDFFPLQAPAGNMAARGFISSPGRNRSGAEWMYHLTIASAQHSLLIENAYFLPNAPMVDALCAAAQRGVKVQIILPGEHMDQKAVHRASRKRWNKLLTAGVEIYEYLPSMIHSKLLIADGLFCSVGSTNLDPRSLWINDEANLDILDVGMARELTAIFQKDLQQSVKVLDAEHSVKSIHTLPATVIQTPLESQF